MESNYILTVAGSKGGVGKTTTSINLGACFADAGYATVVVEADLPMANLIDFVSLDIDMGTAETLHDVLAGEARVVDAVYEIGDRLSVVPSGTDLDQYERVEVERLEGALEHLWWHYEVIILDTPAGMGEEVIRPVTLADEVILISTPRVSSVRNTRNTKAVVERAGTDIRGLVLSKSGTGASPGAERIAEFLDLDLLGHVPEDDAVPHSQDRGKPVVEFAPHSGAATAYRKIAGQLVDSINPSAGRAMESGPSADDDGTETADGSTAAPEPDTGPAESRETAPADSGENDGRQSVPQDDRSGDSTDRDAVAATADPVEGEPDGGSERENEDAPRAGDDTGDDRGRRSDEHAGSAPVGASEGSSGTDAAEPVDPGPTEEDETTTGEGTSSEEDDTSAGEEIASEEDETTTDETTTGEESTTADEEIAGEEDETTADEGTASDEDETMADEETTGEQSTTANEGTASDDDETMVDEDPSGEDGTPADGEPVAGTDTTETREPTAEDDAEEERADAPASADIESEGVGEDDETGDDETSVGETGDDETGDDETGDDETGDDETDGDETSVGETDEDRNAEVDGSFFGRLRSKIGL